MRRADHHSPLTAYHSRPVGSVLLVVLVVIALLTLATYTFTETMLAEAEATAMFARGVESRAFAESGVELAAAYLGTRTGYGADNFYHNPELFQGIPLRDGPTERSRGRFTLVAPVEDDPTAGAVRYGVTDESGKRNLNALMQPDMTDEQRLTALMMLPGMTVETADAILDWLDTDEEPRPTGAESDYYLTLVPPYPAKNGPIESLEELLLVAGVTPMLLLGEDANRNGLLDGNENDGPDRPPLDNADGLLDLGWSAFLTTDSREANRRIDGTPRINLNHSLLTELYDQLEPEFGEDVARFIVAYRSSGPKNTGGSADGGSDGGSDNVEDGDRDSDSDRDGGRGADSEQTENLRSKGNGSGGSSNSAQGDGGSAGGGNGRVEQLAQSLAQSLTGGAEGSVTRGGIDLKKGGQHKINSLYDLVGAQVEVKIDGQDTLLDSPWPDDPRAMTDYLPALMDAVSTTDEEFLVGRINVNLARREVLLGVPGMTEQLADMILAARSGTGGQPAADTAARATTGWLVAEGLIDLTQMRELDRYLTTQGDVYRVQSVGYFDAGGPVVRLEALIDATQLPPRTIFLRDLSHLGRGYAPEHLLPYTEVLRSTSGVR